MLIILPFYFTYIQLFACSTEAMARAMEGTQAPVFRYEFTYSEGPSWFGASHAAELQYVFGQGLNPYTPSFQTDKQKLISIEIMRYWTNFIKTRWVKLLVVSYSNASLWWFLHYEQIRLSEVELPWTWCVLPGTHLHGRPLAPTYNREVKRTNRELSGSNADLTSSFVSIISEFSHYVWPGSCTVESLLISSCQIFQAAFIFEI